MILKTGLAAAVVLLGGCIDRTVSGPTQHETKVIELDKDLKIVWQLDENDVPGNPLRLPAGCQRLPNSNTIVCNYLPGGFLGKQPQAFEVTRDKRVVWEFSDHARFRTVNQIYLLDLPGKEKTSAVLR